MGNFAALPVDFYALQETMANTRTINGIHAVGKEVYLWTVNGIEYVDTYVRMGVDGFITDEVPMIQEEVQKIHTQEHANPRLVLQILGYEIDLWGLRGE